MGPGCPIVPGIGSLLILFISRIRIGIGCLLIAVLGAFLGRLFRLFCGFVISCISCCSVIAAPRILSRLSGITFCCMGMTVSAAGFTLVWAQGSFPSTPVSPV